MSNEVAVYDQQDLTVVSRPPEIVLREAQTAAKALADVVSKKKKPIMMNGEQYLEFEDWQTVGKFYGVTAKVISTEYIEYGEVRGFEAKAVALRSDGMEISAAEAMCLNDEPNWKTKPLFQLRSMSQTRACAKALRNVLAWVVVLAGYRPTPAEEIQDMAQQQKGELKEPQKKNTGNKPSIKDPDAPASEPQVKAIQTMIEKYGITDDETKHEEISNWLSLETPIASVKDLTKGQASQIIDFLNQALKESQG